MKLLIIEDEKELSAGIRAYLQDEHFICEQAFDFRAAMEKINMYEYDCILLDISLPGGSGLDILKELKAQNKSEGIIIISARNAQHEKIEGLLSGADDYLAKPFHLPELAARIAAVIRRRSFDGKNTIEYGSVVVDLGKKQVKVHDKPVELTKTEYELFIYFISNKNRVISKSAIAEHLWGDDMDMSDNYDHIYSHIKNLRKKLSSSGAAAQIRSVYGMGYKFETDQ